VFEPEDVAEALQAQLGGQPVLGLYQANEVRETPRWPGSWANCSLLSLYSHRNARAHHLAAFGPT
jgi:hypothetical protein